MFSFSFCLPILFKTIFKLTALTSYKIYNVVEILTFYEIGNLAVYEIGNLAFLKLGIWNLAFLKFGILNLYPPFTTPKVDMHVITWIIIGVLLIYCMFCK